MMLMSSLDSLSIDFEMENNLWSIGSIHHIYGKCTMMARIEGEQIRWFEDKDGVISMIPLATLNYEISNTGLE